HAAAEVYDAYYNRFFLEGVFKGRYPKLVLEAFEPHLPKNWQDDFSTIQEPLDWVGLNYYTRKIIAPNDGPWPHHHEVPGPLPKTFMDWEIYPQGLYDFLVRTAREYTGDLPILITENGMSNADILKNGAVHDPERIDYLNQHFEQARRAISDGVPLQGYFVWSLLDNYEWALGYEKRFGLIHVDFETLERTPKSSYQALTSALKD
ncbi:MAG: family 1 glycosylhydrolase, partial [Dinoroseobacter sp.]|nr:family 1 glycosylhydrolase [Dinoroseobacter sp.]